MSVATWSSPRWRAAAVAWLDERLAAAGIERTGEVEQTHLRPWATVLRAPTARGPVWLKAAGPGTAFEAGLYEVLARVAPGDVLAPVAVDAARGWMLLPDGGASLGDRRAGTDALVAALVEYGRLQRRLAPHVDELLAAGVSDMRPPVMPARFEEALDAVGGRAAHPEIAALANDVAAWCARLAASPVPASLDHNDLHPWNILGGGEAPVRYYDWGDSVVAHPFAAMLVPLGFVQRALGDPGVRRARDAYLAVFADLAPHDERVATLETACRVAKIARALTWERALLSAREQGEAVDEDWATAPLETLASLLDESYLGGG
jgi:Phosphotransferase enzyme family